MGSGWPSYSSRSSIHSRRSSRVSSACMRARSGSVPFGARATRASAPSSAQRTGTRVLRNSTVAANIHRTSTRASERARNSRKRVGKSTVKSGIHKDKPTRKVDTHRVAIPRRQRTPSRAPRTRQRRRVAAARRSISARASTHTCVPDLRCRSRQVWARCRTAGAPPQPR